MFWRNWPICWMTTANVPKWPGGTATAPCAWPTGRPRNTRHDRPWPGRRAPATMVCGCTPCVGALSRVEQVLAIDRELGDRVNEAVGLMNLVYGRLSLGDLTQAQNALEASLVLLRTNGDQLGYGISTAHWSPAPVWPAWLWPTTTSPAYGPPCNRCWT